MASFGLVAALLLLLLLQFADELLDALTPQLARLHLKSSLAFDPRTAFTIIDMPTPGKVDALLLTDGSLVEPGRVVSRFERDKRHDSVQDEHTKSNQAPTSGPDDRTFLHLWELIKASARPLLRDTVESIHGNLAPELTARAMANNRRQHTPSWSRAWRSLPLGSSIVTFILFLIIFGSLYLVVTYLLNASRALAQCSMTTTSYVSVTYTVTSYISPIPAAVSDAVSTQAPNLPTITSTSTSTSTQTILVSQTPSPVTALTSANGPSYYYVVISDSTSWINSVSPSSGMSLTTTTATVYIVPTASSVDSAELDTTTISPPAYTSTSFSVVPADSTSTFTTTVVRTQTISNEVTMTRYSYAPPGSAGWNSTETVAPTASDLTSASLPPSPTVSTVTGTIYWSTGTQVTSTSLTTLTLMLTRSLQPTITLTVSDQPQESSAGPQSPPTTYPVVTGISTPVLTTPVMSEVQPPSIAANVSSGLPLESSANLSSLSSSTTAPNASLILPATASSSQLSSRPSSSGQIGPLTTASGNASSLTTTWSMTSGEVPQTYGTLGYTPSSATASLANASLAGPLPISAASVTASVGSISSIVSASLSSAPQSNSSISAAPASVTNITSSRNPLSSQLSNITTPSSYDTTPSSLPSGQPLSSTSAPIVSAASEATPTPTSETSSYGTNSSTSAADPVVATSTNGVIVGTQLPPSIQTSSTVSASVSPSPSSTSLELQSSPVTSASPSTSSGINASVSSSSTSSSLTTTSTSYPNTSIEAGTSVSSSSTSIGTVTSASISPAPSVCGEHGDFMLNFDDLPTFSTNINETDITQAPPIFNGYHHLAFSNGYIYAPPPRAPYPPVSEPHLAIFLADAAGNASTPSAMAPTSVMIRPGEIGDGSSAPLSAFWFNAYSAWLGCDNEGPDPCTYILTAYIWNSTVQQETEIASQNATTPGCPGFNNCRLQQVGFPASFTGLSGLQIRAYKGQEEVMFFMDDLSLGWYNNTCGAGLQRLQSPRGGRGPLKMKKLRLRWLKD